MKSKQDKWLPWIKRLALPLALAVVTVIGVQYYLSQKSKALDEQSQQQMVTRVVAANNLPAGTIIGFEHLSVRDMPQAWVGPDSFAPEDAQVLEGQVLLQALIAGQPITRSVVSAPKPPALSRQLAPGRRAVTIPVNHISSLSGRLDVDDVIDVYVTFMHAGQRITTLLVSAVRVLATDKPLFTDELNQTSQTVSSVTLDVSAAQAVRLVSANQDGVLTAVLRLDEQSDNPNKGGVSSAAEQANHLAGFVGLEPSLLDGQPPMIIYGDAAVSGAADQ